MFTIALFCRQRAAESLVLRHLASTAPIVKEALSGLLVFALAGAASVGLWRWLAQQTGSHDAATSLFTGLAFAAATTALFFQHRAIAGTRRDVERTAVALEGVAKTQVVQGALMEHDVRMSAAVAEIQARQGVGHAARVKWIQEARLEQDGLLRERLRQIGATEMLDQLPPHRNYT